MAQDRVDKAWQQKGLKDYSLGAILGTLAHYGVNVDEAGFKKLAEDTFPIRIATGWLQSWSGTGQFSRFPLAAAGELYRRFYPDALVPDTYAEALAKLLMELDKLLRGQPGAKVADAFQAMEALNQKVPQKDGHAKEGFTEEVFARFDQESLGVFDEMGERLAKEGHDDDALSFVKIEEFLFREREVVATALVKAALGKKDEAITALTARAQDTKVADEGRLLSVDGLIHLEAYDPARAQAEALMDTAEKSENHHLALALGGRLAHLYEVQKDNAALEALEPRMRKVAEAHAIAHPGHHH